MNAKVEHRVIIKFLLNEREDATEIHDKFLRASQEDAYTFSSVYEWIRAFKMGQTSVLDEHRAERPRFDHIDSTIL
jgi:hypothetical protein